MAFQHDLAHEFPEMKDAIHTLKTSDMHFKNLFDKYETVAKELHRMDEGAAGVSDEHAEELKKQRLELKDQLYKMLKKASGGCGSSHSCGCSGGKSKTSH